MSDDSSYHIGGIREPDPTLRRGAHRSRRVKVERIAGDEQAAPPELQPPAAKPRRQRVVLADPRRRTTVLRAKVELEEQTSWGELLIKDLVRAQLRTGVTLAVLVLLVLGALPLLFYLFPAFAAASVVGVPLPWLLLGVAVFPLLFGVGLWYNHRAERHERDFVDMIEN